MHTRPRGRQSGASLFVALVMMIAITLIGLGAAKLSTGEERMARNARDSNIALQAGEAALRDAETDIRVSRALSGATLFSNTCDQTGGKGLCVPATSGDTRWEAYLNDTSRSIAYGEITGAPAFRPASESGGVAAAPRYIIEAIPDTTGTSLRAGAARFVYRITSVGYGAIAGTEVQLQEFFRP